MTALRTVPLAATHWPWVAAVYAAGIEEGHATFETEVPRWEDFDAARLADHRFVALDADLGLVGWVACSPTSTRPVYRGVVEHSVYVDPAARGRGVGRALLDALVASTEAAGIWTIQSGIFPENVASLALHRAAGFVEVGVRRRLGLMRGGPCDGRWRDVVLMERRSEVVG
ncbi:N-acetyltransferase family protein [Nocardioides iriomotensis]|uniref:N-acetyltransferase family protein n=1 Tax=Nocardioides iriomotensis TaxID=715784 RepID=A0A4Q5IU67_9ACTN|nr:GNAT family N-acetyltransferase [Nocardioides iriomotensis]RYU09424.1 N-acetyltransferase family protein [Nocardioides iriomotensis]